MRTDILQERIPNIPAEILDQLARTNQEPKVHRYIQLHNSYELVVRFCAIVSYLWVTRVDENAKVLAEVSPTLHRPSLDTWSSIFTSCSKLLHSQGLVSRNMTQDLGSRPASRVLSRVAEIAQTQNIPKRASTAGLIQSIIRYRNLTRGHGCIVHDGYEEFIEDLDAALFDLMIFWKKILDVRWLVRGSDVFLRIDGHDVCASLFLRKNEQGRIEFYNRKEHLGRSTSSYYFLSYDTGLHTLVPQQKERVDEEIRLHQSNSQLSLFPATKTDVERTFGRREIHEIKKFLSFDYGDSRELHPSDVEELRFLVGIHRFSREVRCQEVLKHLLAKLTPDDRPGDVCYDFGVDSWRSLDVHASGAVAEFRESAGVEDLADLLIDRIEGLEVEHSDDDVRQKLRETADAISAFLEQDQD